MPKTRSDINVKLDDNFRDVVACGLVKARISKDVLIHIADISLPTYYSRMKSPEKMTLKELRAYVRALNLKDEEILSFLK